MLKALCTAYSMGWTDEGDGGVRWDAIHYQSDVPAFASNADQHSRECQGVHPAFVHRGWGGQRTLPWGRHGRLPQPHLLLEKVSVFAFQHLMKPLSPHRLILADWYIWLFYHPLSQLELLVFSSILGFRCQLHFLHELHFSHLKTHFLHGHLGQTSRVSLSPIYHP